MRNIIIYNVTHEYTHVHTRTHARTHARIPHNTHTHARTHARTHTQHTHARARAHAHVQRFTAHVMESTAAATTRFFGIVSSTVKQATTAFKMKNPDQEFSKHTKYFASLAELMSVLERVGTRLHQERSEFAIVLDDFSTALFGWATNESMLQHSLQRVAGCVETCCVGIGTLVRQGGGLCHMVGLFGCLLYRM